MKLEEWLQHIPGTPSEVSVQLRDSTKPSDAQAFGRESDLEEHTDINLQGVRGRGFFLDSYIYSMYTHRCTQHIFSSRCFFYVHYFVTTKDTKSDLSPL